MVFTRTANIWNYYVPEENEIICNRARVCSDLTREDPTESIDTMNSTHNEHGQDKEYKQTVMLK